MLAGAMRRQRNFIDHGRGMVGEQQLRLVDAVQAEQALDKVGLTPQQQAASDARCVPQLAPVEVPAVDRPLGRHQLAVKLREWQACRQYRVLDVEQAIIAGLQPASVGDPTLGPRIGSVDADIDDVGHFQTPVADDPKALVVPAGVGDQVYRDIDAERAGEFDSLEIAAERNPFAVFPQPLLVDGFEAEKHGFEPEPLPQAERLLVAQQHVAASFQVISLADTGAGDRLADLHPMALMDKSNVVDDENPRLADRPKILDDAFRADQSVTAAVKGPRAAERAIPRTAARELDRGARV